jgi:hypothetical protein
MKSCCNVCFRENVVTLFQTKACVPEFQNIQHVMEARFANIRHQIYAASAVMHYSSISILFVEDSTKFC